MSVLPLRPAPAAPLDNGIHVARIVEVTEGRAVVVLDGRRVQARCALALAPQDGEPWLGRAVLVALEGGNPALPVIVGVVGDLLPVAAARPDSDHVTVDGRRITLEGREEVVLRCGEASVTLRADGQVIVKGQRITSRAAETHKIRGATVQIN